MNKKILLTSIVSVLSVITIAYADSIMTSKGYVDTQIDTTQVKIPASNPNNATLGDTVMTYTAAGNGTIGERGIYSDASSYTATDEDKLITASALKGAFDALPTTTTTKLVCANDPACTLWTITPQTAYGNSGSGGGSSQIDWSALVDTPGTDYTYNAAAMTWETVFPYGDVSGVAVCNDTGGSFAVASNADQYETGGVNCWCRMTHPAVSRWVFVYAYFSSSVCADYCASICGANVRYDSAFRSGMFGSIQQ